MALLIIVSFVIAVYAMTNRTFEAEFPHLKASNDSSVIARGKYLAFGPAHCSGCHVKIEDQINLKEGEYAPLSGGFDFELPFGHIYTANLTSDKETGIGALDDKTIARSLRHGVRRDGKAMFDFMPFQNLSNEDMVAVISFLRTLPPVKNKVPENDYNFLGKALMAFAIKPVGPTGAIIESIQKDSTVEYGKYLVYNVANCRGCHSPRDLKTGEYTGPDLSGGLVFESMIEKGAKTITPNLTPEPETGVMANWTEEQFIARIKLGRLISISEMPWSQFQNMDSTDLKAIYKYLKTVKPIHNKIEKTYVAANKN